MHKYFSPRSDFLKNSDLNSVRFIEVSFLPYEELSRTSLFVFCDELLIIDVPRPLRHGKNVYTHAFGLTLAMCLDIFPGRDAQVIDKMTRRRRADGS